MKSYFEGGDGDLEAGLLAFANTDSRSQGRILPAYW
jgi:hypothetical protein